MQRALLIGATGSVILFSAYMLIHGEAPRVVERASTTVPAPITDSSMEPAVSGSVSSITRAIAQDGNDPHLADRPVALGGDRANTGQEQDPVTFKSLEQQKTVADAMEQQTDYDWSYPECEHLDKEGAGRMEMWGCHKVYPDGSRVYQ